MPTAGFISYPAGHDDVTAVLVLPHGTVRERYFEIGIGTNGAFAGDTDVRHGATDFDFLARYSTRKAAARAVADYADAVGAEPPASGALTFPETVDGRFSASIREQGADASGYEMIFTVGFDKYHSAAVDRILRDGTVALDATRVPSRAELGFRPTYDSADVIPEPRGTMTLALTTAAGTARLPADAILSSGATHPTDTVVEGGGDLAAAEAALVAAAPVIGADPAEIVAAAAAARTELDRRDVACADTPAATCALRIETTAETGTPTMSYRLTLTWRG